MGMGARVRKQKECRVERNYGDKNKREEDRHQGRLRELWEWQKCTGGKEKLQAGTGGKRNRSRWVGSN